MSNVFGNGTYNEIQNGGTRHLMFQYQCTVDIKWTLSTGLHMMLPGVFDASWCDYLLSLQADILVTSYTWFKHSLRFGAPNTRRHVFGNWLFSWRGVHHRQENIDGSWCAGFSQASRTASKAAAATSAAEHYQAKTLCHVWREISIL